MVLGVFAVFDVKADSYNTPFFMSTNGQAVRAFTDLAKNKESTVGAHPEDYKLVRIGSYDMDRGLLVPDEHVSLGFATDYLPVASAVPAIRSA